MRYYIAKHMIYDDEKRELIPLTSKCSLKVNSLTPQEGALVSLLAREFNRYYENDEIANKIVIGGNGEGVAKLIGKIRSKTGGTKTSLIENRRELGYRLTPKKARIVLCSCGKDQQLDTDMQTLRDFVKTVFDRYRKSAVPTEVITANLRLQDDGIFKQDIFLAAFLIPNPDKPEKIILYFPRLCYSIEKGGFLLCYLRINTLIKFMASLPVMTA